MIPMDKQSYKCLIHIASLLSILLNEQQSIMSLSEPHTSGTSLCVYYITTEEWVPDVVRTTKIKSLTSTPHSHLLQQLVLRECKQHHHWTQSQQFSDTLAWQMWSDYQWYSKTSQSAQ